MRLDEKRVVIIGGSSGIGLETARLALAEGAFVTIAGRSEDRLRRAAERPGILVRGRRGQDAVGSAAIRRRRHGRRRVDPVAVRRRDAGRSPLRAGRGTPPGGGDVLESDLERLRSILEVRLLGVAHAVRQARTQDGRAARSR